MQHILAIVTVVVVGLMVGVEFAVATFVNAIFYRLPDEGAIAARGDGGRLLGKVMPVWYIGSLILSAIWMALAWGEARAGLVVAAAALLVVSILMSVAVLVPMNSRAVQWTAQDHPADWKQQAARWDRYHYARVAVIVAAFVLLVIAIA